MGWRATIRSSLTTTLVAWEATLPFRAELWTTRPESFPGTPAVYIGRIRQVMNHAGQTLRSTDGTALIVLVGTPGANREEAAQLDIMADSLVDWLSDNPHLVAANTVAEPTEVDSGELELGDGVIYPTVTVTLGNILIREGV